MPSLDRTFNIADLREQARRRIPKGIFEFVDRGTEDEVALRNNRLAFERIKLRPRVLVDVSTRSQDATILGRQHAMPVAIAPTGAAGLFWHEGELALAKAAAAANVPFTLATGSMTPLEKIAEQAGGRLWFQLYMWGERSLSHQLVQRAHKAGYEGLVVTVDTAVSPNREYNPRNGFGLPFRPTLRGTLDIAAHPLWLTRVLLRYLLTTGMPKYENFPPEFRRNITAGSSVSPLMRNDSLTWDDARELRRLWPGKFMLKGIMREDDAVRAAEIGADAIIVSNHGGRNLDGTMAPIEVLPRIAEAVGGRTTVLLDSGIRRGSDILKALALGAQAVLVGRATLYGVALGGQAGAAHALKLLKREMDIAMAFLGCPHIADITPDILEPPTPAAAPAAVPVRRFA